MFVAVSGKVEPLSSLSSEVVAVTSSDSVPTLKLDRFFKFADFVVISLTFS